MKRVGLVAVVGSLALGAAGVATAKPDMASLKGAHPAASGSSSVHSWQADVAESFRKRRPNPEEMRAAIAKARAGAKGKREARIAEIREHLGASALGNRDVVDELRVHAKRMAFLDRAKVVATTELDEPKRATTLARIDKLTAAEQTRHQRRVDALQAIAVAAPSAAPPGSASATAAASKGNVP